MPAAGEICALSCPQALPTPAWHYCLCCMTVMTARTLPRHIHANCGCKMRSFLCSRLQCSRLALLPVLHDGDDPTYIAATHPCELRVQNALISVLRASMLPPGTIACAA